MVVLRWRIAKLCLGPDEQADACHTAFCSVAARLLALTAVWCWVSKGKRSPPCDIDSRESAVLFVLNYRLRDYFSRPGKRRRDANDCWLDVLRPSQQRRRSHLEVCREIFLAVKAGDCLSAPGATLLP